MKINQRGVDILRLLTLKENYITYGDLAEKLGVSSKTVAREIANLENVLNASHIKLIRKSGVGIKLKVLDEKGKSLLQELINQEHLEYSSQERQSIILTYLLKSQEPVKQFVFSSMFKVTDTTIGNDLNKVEKIIGKYNLTLVRKSGLGVYLQGSETDIRKAIIGHIYANVGADFTLDFFYDNNEIKLSDKAKTFLHDLVNPLVISKVEYATDLIMKQEDYSLEENAYTGLVIHLTLSIQRLLNEDGITEENPLIQSYINTREYKIASGISDLLSTIFQVDIPKAETGYIVLHLLGARNNYQKSEVLQLENLKLTMLAREIITESIGIYGRSIPDKKRLLVDLVKHLGPAITRLQLKMPIRNPLLEQLEANYPQMMSLAEKACTPLKNYLKIKAIPRDEIGFIAMHLGAAFQEEKVNRRLKALVACPMGLGTSRFLAYQLKQHYSQLEIIGIISSKDQDHPLCREADLILSTVKMEHPFLPVYQVGYILSDSDYKGLNLLLKSLPVRNKQTTAEKLNKSFGKDLKVLQDLTQGIEEILDSCRYTESEAKDLKEISEYLSYNLFTTSNPQLLNEDFLKREAKGSTIYRGVMVFHTRSEALTTMQLSIVRLQEDLDVGGEKVKVILAMAAPVRCSDVKIEALSYLSQVLIEQEEMLDLFKAEDKETVSKEIERLYRNYLNIKFKEIMEV